MGRSYRYTYREETAPGYIYAITYGLDSSIDQPEFKPHTYSHGGQGEMLAYLLYTYSSGNFGCRSGIRMVYDLCIQINKYIPTKMARNPRFAGSGFVILPYFQPCFGVLEVGRVLVTLKLHLKVLAAAPEF